MEETKSDKQAPQLAAEPSFHFQEGLSQPEPGSLSELLPLPGVPASW